MPKKSAKFIHSQEDLHNIFCLIYHLFNKKQRKTLEHIDITIIIREIYGDPR